MTINVLDQLAALVKQERCTGRAEHALGADDDCRMAGRRVALRQRLHAEGGGGGEDAENGEFRRRMPQGRQAEATEGGTQR